MVMQEWNNFLRDNEAALKLEGAQVTENLESAIEENLIEELQGWIRQQRELPIAYRLIY